MSNKQNGIVTFKMTTKQGLDVTETTYETPGVLFYKDDQYFLFYDEESVEDKSVTKCRYEFTQDELRIRRKGNVTVEQAHKIGIQTKGYMKTVYGNLDTMVKTHQLSITSLTTSVEVIVDYDLYVSGDRVGNYQLTVVFNKEAV